MTTTTGLNILLILSFLVLVPLFFQTTLAQPKEDDIKCLQGLKNSFRDPKLKLRSWGFSKIFPGFICNFAGVSCWNDMENRIIALQLNSMQLRGEIPDSLQYCRSLQSLTLSQNYLSGSIPSKICDWLPFLVTLDLSGNNFTGPIPVNLANCSYLNNLNLGANYLSGNIPYQLSALTRLRKFSVANNALSGQIPSFLSNFSSASFAGNFGLCGPPLKTKCKIVRIYNNSGSCVC